MSEMRRTFQNPESHMFIFYRRSIFAHLEILKEQIHLFPDSNPQ